MAKRKSIGCDPLDWIGEAGAETRQDQATAGGAGTPPAPDGEAAVEPTAGSGQGGQPGGGSAAMLSLPDHSPQIQIEQLQLERQLLLIEGAVSARPVRPLLNQRHWTLLLLLISLGVAAVLFQETRRQWRERIVILDRALERVEKEKDRSERVLAQVISEKDSLIRETQGALAKAEILHDEALEELRHSRAESRRLQVENQGLLERMLKESDARRGSTSPLRPDPEEPRSALPSGKPASQPQSEEGPPATPSTGN